MGKALFAVGTVLAVFFVIFGGVVFLTRDEDTYAVDNVLSERFSRAIAEAEDGDETVDLRNLTDFDFDQVLIFGPSESRDAISQQLGFDFQGDLRYTAESSLILVFTNNGHFVKFADYRGPGVFEGLEQPFARLSANDAVFRVQDGVARPE